MMSTQDALTAAHVKIIQLEAARSRTFSTLNQHELIDFEHHLESYIENVTEQFPLTGNSIGGRISVWLEQELAQSSKNTPQPAPDTVSPIEAHLEAMIVVDWYTLLLVKVAYPGIPVFNFHTEYCTDLNASLCSIRAHRRAVSQQYDQLRLEFRDTLIDAGIGKLTVSQVNDTLDTLFDAGMRSLRNKAAA